MRPIDSEAIKILLDDYGLEMILLQNDIEEYFILEYLVNEGLVDLDEYFFTDG